MGQKKNWDPNLWEDEGEYVGQVQGHKIFVRYHKEGPDLEELKALYREMQNDTLFESLLKRTREEEK